MARMRKVNLRKYLKIPKLSMSLALLINAQITPSRYAETRLVDNEQRRMSRHRAKEVKQVVKKRILERMRR
jgi:hypothetical protein